MNIYYKPTFNRAIAWLAGVLLLAVSCTKDPSTELPDGGAAGTGRTITAAFDLTKDFEQAVEVKADGSEDVTTIKDLWVIQLAADGLSLLQDPLYITSLTSVDGGYRVEFKVQEVPGKVVFVANTHDETAYAGLTLTSTEGDVVSVARTVASEYDLTANGVPMSGMWSGTPVIAVPGKVAMTRAVAKVSFELGANLPVGESFEVQSVQVRQVPAMLSYYRDEATLKDYPYPVLTADNICDYEIETPENKRFAGGGILLII